MRIAHRLILALLFPMLVLMLAQNAHAVLLYASDTRNTSAPTGAYANSGWQFEGQVGGFLATVISKKFIITAGHTGITIGNNFVINGENHRVVQVWGDPNSDLRILQTVGSFGTPAPMFKDSTEVGRSTMIFGRGTTRGDPVTVNGVLKGWKWGTQDGVQSWGRNAISAVVRGGTGNAELLKMPFDPGGTTFEGAITRGDSGGGVFVKQGAYWKLAGINYSADGQFSTSSDGSNPFDAAIFDRSGLWQQGSGFFPSSGAAIPTSGYATRISSRLSWIGGVLGGTIKPGIPDPGTGSGTGTGPAAPEPATGLTMIALAGTALLRHRRPKPAARCG